ncbi:MAG: hypothetical protein WD750_00880, partial [Gammaproteobacteria bacterium]
QPRQALWFAVRVYGEQGSVAHSAPVYVQVGDDKRFWKRDAVGTIAASYLTALDDLRDSMPDPGADFEMFDTAGRLVSQWLNDRPVLLRQIDAAKREYQRLVAEAEQPDS